MRSMAAIIKKEWKVYFYSPVAYVAIALFLFIMGFIFDQFVAIYQLYNQRAAMGMNSGISVDRLIGQLFQNMAFVMAFLSPMLTMKLFAEEKRQQTFELLFTSPIRGSALVIGKFIAALGLMCVMLLLSFAYNAFLIAWGNPDVNVIATTYLGMVLVLGCYLAMGGLVSAMVSSQAVAAIINFVLILILYLFQSIGPNMSAKWGPIEWGPLLVYITPMGHFSGFAAGMIHVKDVVFFVTFIGMMLFLTHKVVDSNRWR